MSKQNFKLFLRDGKWWGNYFPERRDAFATDQDGSTIGACDEKWLAETIEKCKSTALEIVNPEDHISQNCLEGEKKKWWIVRDGLYTPIIAGDLYDWDGEVKHINACAHESCPFDACCEHCKEPKELFKLLPKQKETEKPGKFKEIFDKSSLFKPKEGGIVAIGVPEQDHPNRKAQIDHWKDVYLDFRDGEGWIRFAERNRLKYYICENHEIDSLREQLAKAKEENERIKREAINRAINKIYCPVGEPGCSPKLESQLKNLDL